MATVIDELVTLLGMEIAPGTIPNTRKYTTMITDMSVTVGFLSAGIVAATTGILVFAEKANRSVRELYKFNTLTGISTDSVQELAFATEQVGGNAQDLESDLINLTKTMSSPIPGEFNHALFMLGVQVKKTNGELKSADEVLLDIADKFEGMSKQEQIQWGSKIGLSTSTILLLKKGREGIEELRKQARDIPILITEKQAKEAQEFIASLDILSRILDFIGHSISSSVSPALKEMVDDFVEWISKSKEWIQLGLKSFVDDIIKGFDDFGEMLGKIISKFREVFPEIDKFTEFLGESGVVSDIVTGALSVLGITLGLLFIKFALVIGVITAAGLIFNDFKTYLEDGDSVLGKLIEAVGELWKAFDDKFPAIGSILETVGGIFKNVGIIILNTFVKSLDLAWEGIKKVGEGVGWIMGLFNEMLGSLGIDKLFKDVGKSVSQFKDTALNTSVASLQNISYSSFMESVAPRIAGIVNNNRTSSAQTKNEIKITNNIQGRNAKEIAEEVTDSLTSLLSRTYTGDLAPVVQ